MTILKSTILSTVVGLVLLISSFALEAQNTSTNVPIEVQTTTLEYLGKTGSVRDLVPIGATDPIKRQTAKDKRYVPKNFVGRGRLPEPNPLAQPIGPDPIRQSTQYRSSVLIEPEINIDGITAGPPNDPTGDVGADHYMQAVNATRIAVYDKQGVLITSFAANTIWSQIGQFSAGDPIILYDQEVDRWIITEFPSGNRLLVAISDDSDPLGNYTAYAFGTPNFPDYPKYGIWSNAYSVTTNEQGRGTHVSYFINREELLAGEPDVRMQRITFTGEQGAPGFFVPTPVDWTGLSAPTEDKPIIVSLRDDAWGSATQDQILVHTFELDWDNPDNSQLVTSAVVTSPYDSDPCSVPGAGFSCVPQPGNGGGLDGIPYTIMNQPHYRNFGSYEVLLMTFITDVSGGNNLSGIRWVEMRRQDDSGWQVYQEGTWAPEDGLDRYMATICMDGSGNIGLAYNVSSEEEFVGVRYTGRRASDPLGVMTVDEYNCVDGNQSIFSGSRFGDYPHMSIDPTDDRTFWFTMEYAGGSSTNTRIVAFNLGKDTVDLAAISLDEPVSRDDLTDMETVTATFENFGLDTLETFSVGYQIADEAPVVEPVNFTLFPDSTYTHSFAQQVDMQNLGDYAFKIFGSVDDDRAPLNDTLRTSVRKIAFFDIGMTDTRQLENIICSDSTGLEGVITNFGTETLTEAEVDVFINGSLSYSQPWTGSLAFGESEPITFAVPGLSQGENLIELITRSPNAEMDQIVTNDTVRTTIDAILSGVSVFLNLTTDEFPAETMWEILDEEDEVIYSGGPYGDAEAEQLLTFELCLDSTACYRFVIEDTYSDGICCDFGEGNVEILDRDGNLIVFSDGEFGASFESDFCPIRMCMLDVDIFFEQESAQGASDGRIFLVGRNGNGELEYSIDGGETFQTNGLFTDLIADSYEIIVRDELGCTYSTRYKLAGCSVVLDIDVDHPSDAGASDGQITIMAESGQEPLMYSINDGVDLQAEPVFENLSDGEYGIFVIDSFECIVQREVVLDHLVSADDIFSTSKITVMPNPSDGLFTVRVDGLSHGSAFVELDILDQHGRWVQSNNLTLYDDYYIGQLSLYKEASGVYFIVLKNSSNRQLVKIIKQD